MSFATLSGKRILVTGSTSGIGRAIAMECARAGADLILNGRSLSGNLQTAAEEASSFGGAVHLVAADVSVESDRRRLFRECLDTGRIDGVVNNAGVDLLTTELRGADYAEKLDRLLQTDVCGTIAVSRMFGQHFVCLKKGAILNIGWDQSDRGMEGDSGELFATAKNAIMGYTRSLALSLAPHVRVNCIAPGWIRTAWGRTAGDYWQQRVLTETPLKRWGEPEDIARMARFLLSEESSYVTGQIINVNGGAIR